MKHISIRIMWAVLGGAIIGFAYEMFSVAFNWLWFLFIPLGCTLIYEARWVHYKLRWMYPKWMLEL